MINYNGLSNEDLLRLNNQFCFSIYACSREIVQLYRPLLKKLDLTYPQYLVMLVLWEHGHVTMKEMGSLLYLDNGTLTPLVRRLIQAGLEVKERSAADERKVYISLTEKGEGLKNEAYAVPNTIMPILLKNQDLKQQMDTLLKEIHQINENRPL
ncbi:MAG: MarR family transcriptional regulator [Planococcus sp. (in: firmicutes)]|nr:MarR family transcriptional regulator [Planococcus sp. (in: firmicutes)]